jgi:small GTP-binding protein
MLKFVLAGNPNSGKTTLFNCLTGSTAHVGNWPGVTVDKREGLYRKKGEEPVAILDLPGIYSLSPYTSEEVIARNYILDEEFKINIFKDKVNVVNYTDIINFTPKEVTIKYDGGLLLIIGNNLSISRLLIDEVLVTGNIEKIELR